MRTLSSLIDKAIMTVINIKGYTINTHESSKGKNVKLIQLTQDNTGLAKELVEDFAELLKNVLVEEKIAQKVSLIVIENKMSPFPSSVDVTDDSGQYLTDSSYTLEITLKRKWYYHKCVW
jgi:hypothetical protein